MNTKNGMRRGVILALSLVVLMMTSSAAVVAQDAPVDGAPNSEPGEDIDYTREEIVIVQDLADEVIRLQLGESEMAVYFGDNDAISLLTTQTKYMGIADVYEQRRGFDKRVGIPVETIFYQKLIGVVEYTDANDNGLFDIQGPKAVGTFDEFEDDSISYEELLKWVDYSDVDWQLSDWTQSQNDNEVDIRFTLSAQDVPYQNDDGVIDSKTVATIAYLFHVTTIEEQISIQAVPHYRILVDEDAPNGDQIDDSELVTTTDVTGTVLNSTWKYDQVIVGWDVATDPVGTERNDTRLAVLTEIAYGVMMDSAVGEWLHEEHGALPAPRALVGHAPPPQVVEQPTHAQEGDHEATDDGPEHDERGHPLRCGLAYVHSGGVIDGDSTGARSQESSQEQNEEEKSDQEKVQERMREYTETACRQRHSELNTDDQSRPEAIRSGALRFEDNGANLGRIRWVSNATVDGLETEVLLQIQGARPILPMDLGSNDGIAAGMRIVGAYNYVLGQSIYHDPEFSADILTMDTQLFGQPTVWDMGGVFLIGKLVRMLPLMIGIVVVVAIGVGVSKTRSRRHVAPLPAAEQYAPAGAWTSDDDWQKYLDG